MPLAIAKRGGIRSNNTTVATDAEGRTICTLHQTRIAILSRDRASVNLYTGGYTTPTTLRRMNECLNAWGFSTRVAKADFASTDTKTIAR